jgi:hypothetical protein
LGCKSFLIFGLFHHLFELICLPVSDLADYLTGIYTY